MCYVKEKTQIKKSLTKMKHYMKHCSKQCKFPRNNKLITRRPSKASQSESPLMRTHNLRQTRSHRNTSRLYCNDKLTRKAVVLFKRDNSNIKKCLT